MAAPNYFVSDIVALTKPKITLMAGLLAWAGLIHAKAHPPWMGSLLSLLAIGALVGGSSALNMYVERELDKKMVRTKNRPLPSGRLRPGWAIATGSLCSLLALIVFYFTGNYLTLLLGAIALFLYVFCYTPLKQRTWLSLLVGSVPGAMPVVLGYTSLSHELDAKAWALFFWAFLWQIPHFLAISLFRESEYTQAGFPVLSKVRHESFAKIMILLSSWLLVLATFGLKLSGILGIYNLLLCLSLGVFFLAVCHQGAFSTPTHEWAKRAFKASLFYQGFLFVALIVGAWC